MNQTAQQSDTVQENTVAPSRLGFAQRLTKWLMLVADLAVVAIGAVAIFGFAARYSWAADLCCQFRVQLLMMLAPASIIYWIWRRGKIATWLLLCTVANLVPLTPYLLPVVKPTPVSETTVTRIMMLNLLSGNQHHDDVVDYVKTHQPDLFIAIEADHEWTESLKPIQRLFPHRYLVDDQGTSSIAAYSRLPFDSIDVHSSTQRRLPSLDMTVTIDQQPVRIFATHPYIPLTHEKARLRNEQFDEIESSLGQSGSRILLGDFNCAPWSPHFGDVLRNTRLTPAGYGHGLRPTWYRRARAYGPLRQTWIFALKLDHVLVSDDLIVVDHQIGPCLGSDHRPVIVDFAPSPSTATSK